MLLPHFQTLLDYLKKYFITNNKNKSSLADVTAALALVHPDAKKGQMLEISFLGSESGLAKWGMAFARALAGQISEKYQELLEEKQEQEDEVEGLIPIATLKSKTSILSELGFEEEYIQKESITLEKLDKFIENLLPILTTGQAEIEAIDLLLETKSINKITNSYFDEAKGKKLPLINDQNYNRVFLYLTKSALYFNEPEEVEQIYSTIYSLIRAAIDRAYIYNSIIENKSDGDDVPLLLPGTPESRIGNKVSDAIHVAIKNKKINWIEELLNDPRLPEIVKKQVALILANFRIFITTNDDEINNIINNNYLSPIYLQIAKYLDLQKVKTCEDIYKSSNPKNSKYNASSTSALNNLANTFVNAFANAGFGYDSLMTLPSDTSLFDKPAKSTDWVMSNKDDYRISAAASQGLIHLWQDTDAIQAIDKYFHDNDNNIKAGGCLAIGVASCGVKNESDPAFALLLDTLEDSNSNISKCSILALGIAYYNIHREDIVETLEPKLSSENDFTTSVFAALASSMIFVGSGNEDIGSNIVQRLMELTPQERLHPHFPLLCLSLGLLYLGQGENGEIFLEPIKTLEEDVESLTVPPNFTVTPAPASTSSTESKEEAKEDKTTSINEAFYTKMRSLGRLATLIFKSCLYAGSGDVLIIQSLLQECTDHRTDNPLFQAVAVLGISLISLGEDIGTNMVTRTLGHLLSYGEAHIRRAVPLALSLTSISHTSSSNQSIIESLSRLTHDIDDCVARNAIFALGLISAGQGQAKVTSLLRQLSEFHSRDPKLLLMVRIAQAFNSLGKGLLTLSPYRADGQILYLPALGALLPVIISLIDIETPLLNGLDYLLYTITPAIVPRTLTLLAPTESLHSNTSPSSSTTSSSSKNNTINLSSVLTADGPEIIPGFSFVRANVRVGQSVETVGQAGKPRTITGFQTHQSPVNISVGERAEIAAPAAPISSVLSGTVIIVPFKQDN